MSRAALQVENVRAVQVRRQRPADAGSGALPQPDAAAGLLQAMPKTWLSPSQSAASLLAPTSR